MASHDLSVFLDQINLNDLHDSPGDDSTLHHIDNMNMYDLLLNINSKPKDTTTPVSNANKIYSATAIDSVPPISTINPKQLNSSKAEATVTTLIAPSSTSTSSNSSSLALPQSQSLNADDPMSISSSDDEGFISPQQKKRNSFNNWSMNDEFNKAIQTWLSQNERISKRNSFTEHSTQQRNVIRTSLSKRRKSDSQVAFRGIHSLSLNNSQPSTKQSTPAPRHSSISIPSSAHLGSALIETNDDVESGENSQNGSTTNLNDDEEEEKPFKCDSCPKAFRRSEHLKRHIRSVHSNIRPFPCKFCEKKFSRSDNLAQHLRTHNKQSQSSR